MPDTANDTSLIDSYLRRATDAISFGDGKSTSQHSDSSLHRPMDETPRVFGGTLSSPHPPSVETAPVLPRNRKVVRRKISTFNLILVLLTSAVAIVLYIGNVIRVGELAGEIGKLQEAHQRNLNDQEILRAHINRLSSLDRIQSMAEKTLGLVNPKQPTVWMDIDREKVQEVASDIAEARERRLKKK